MSAPGDNLPLVTGMLEALTDRVRAEREGRLRAEARVRALEEALGEALEASRDPRAEAVLAEVRKDALEAITDFPAGDEHEWGNGVRAQAEDTLDILIRHGFGGGS